MLKYHLKVSWRNIGKPQGSHDSHLGKWTHGIFNKKEGGITARLKMSLKNINLIHKALNWGTNEIALNPFQKLLL
jgi:hypothetical protein